MRWLAHLITLAIVNVFALLVAANYIGGFILEGGFKELTILALIFTLLNILLKPALTLLFGPVIVLTLGFGLLIVNALLLFILDTLSKNLTIQTIPALLYSTLLIGVINWVTYMGLRRNNRG